jgi:Na+/alanine symporter
VTGLVILLYADGEGLDGIPLALTAYARLAGQIGGECFACVVGAFLSVSVVLFAVSTVLAQSACAAQALSFVLPRAAARRCVAVLAANAALLGGWIRASSMWAAADLVITLMTVVNCACLWRMRRQVRGEPRASADAEMTSGGQALRGGRRLR